MDKKLTDKEIVKALEVCSSGDDGCEKGCPLQGKCISPIRGSEKIMRDAIDLINRLQSENKNLMAEVEKQKKKVERLFNRVFDQCL